MGFNEILEKVESSVVFKRIKQENKEMELCAGFFILDFLSNDNKQTIDYKIGDKIFTFEVKREDIILREDKLIQNEKFPELKKIEPDVKVDIEEIPSLAEKQAEMHNINSKFHKIIAVLQKYKPENEDKDIQIWNLTCMLDGLTILNILINSDTGETIKFERKSMADFIKRV
jgi:hypothetical protein